VGRHAGQRRDERRQPPPCDVSRQTFQSIFFRWPTAASTERLGSFSDGVFAVIITIMVLELKPPLDQPSFGALLPPWPTALSYLVSYYLIAIAWVNHHHLLRFAEHATPRLVWVNFAHLFTVSWFLSQRRG
jgi:uncharacterized membrane protein